MEHLYHQKPLSATHFVGLTRLYVVALLLLLSLTVFSTAGVADDNAAPAVTNGDSSGDAITPTDQNGNPCDDTPISACGDDSESPDTGPSDGGPLTTVGNPISLVTGNKFQRERDYFVNGSVLEFSRNYNSALSDHSNRLGQGWSGTFGSRIVELDSGGYLITDSAGRTFRFDLPSDNQNDLATYRSAAATDGYIQQAGNKFYWYVPDGRKLTFLGSFLVRVDFPGHQFITLFYRNKRLAEVSDEAGRTLKFEYTEVQSGLAEYTDDEYKDVPNNLERLILPDNTAIEYDYDESLNLARVRFEDGSSTQYHYENEVYPNHLTGITDRLGNRYASWKYNEFGLAISSEHANGAKRVDLAFEVPDSDDDVGVTHLTNSRGHVSTYRWQRDFSTGDILLLSSVGPGCSTCPPANMRYTYTQDNKLASSTNIGGVSRHFHYDEKGRIEKIERVSAVSDLSVLEVRYEYDENGDRPVRLFRPSVNSDGEYQLSLTYNAENLPVEISESGFAPTVPSASGQLASLYKPISRTTKLSYEAGRVSEVDGPRTDVEDITRFQYDQLGRIIRIDLPSGEVIAISEYDEHGRALQFRRAQHPPVTAEYDVNGNINRITQLGQSVIYEHNAENKLIRLTTPDGKTSTLSYDEAQHLERVSDDLGREVALSFDSESRVQSRSFVGVNGVLIRSMNYVFDAEGRIQSVTEEQSEHTTNSTISKTIDIEYDETGQLTGASDPSTGFTQSYVFNDLGKLLSSMEPNGLSVQKEYDVHNRLISQTDRRLNSTRYYRDDFGNVHFLNSPDSGLTEFDYDEAGNRIEKQTANGDVTQYQWDSANRLVEQNSSDGKTTYTYDRESGRLLETVNPNSSETYTYTEFAQLKTHTRHIDDRKFTTKYVYESNGKIRNKILPDGQSLRYHYHESGPLAHTLRAITREGLLGLQQSTLLAEIDLDWRDGQTSFLSHNGRRNEVQYRADGKVSSIEISDTLSLSYEYDEHGNITGISKDGYDQRYSYTSGQLTGASTVTGNYRYQYDAVGNRTVASATGTQDDHDWLLSFNPVGKGNRLRSRENKKSTEQVDYQHNDAGAPIRIGELHYTYNIDQRPIEVSRNGRVIAQYRYNSFGERIKKVSYSQNQKKTTYYLYDNRTLVAEIDANSAEHRQTIYLKQTPVAHLIGKRVYGVHSDNLGTPKLVTNDSGETVWQAAHTPLGKATVSNESIQFNLRLPGQYADVETGTHYNYQRDYDPSTGRYLTSDPVGLEGGDNTYAYANNNVLGAVDVLGLSSQLIGQSGHFVASGNILGGHFSNDNQVEPFTLSAVNSPVQNPSTEQNDSTAFDAADPEELVTSYLTITSPCDKDAGIANFNTGITQVLNGYPDHLLVDSQIQNVINIGRGPAAQPSNEIVSVALENWVGFTDDSWLLLIPYCADDAAVTSIVEGALGKLVEPEEITAMMASLGEKDANGCRPAGIIDVTELHEQVLKRFQIKLATDPRVVAAEQDLLLAQKLFDDFVRLYGDPCLAGQLSSPTSPLCEEYYRLQTAVINAAEHLASVLDSVYDELIGGDYMPARDVATAEAELRKKIILGVVGLFIPLTLTDAAIDAATYGFSKIGRLFTGAVDLFTTLRRGNRSNVDSIIGESADVARRVDAIKMEKYTADYPVLANLDYKDLAVIDGLGPDKLAKLADDAASNPQLATQMANNPDFIKWWKHWDDLGETTMRQNFEDVRLMGKNNRPPVTDYLSPSYIANHKAQFEDGAVRFVNKTKFDEYGVSNVDGTTFVMTKAEADRVWAETGGDPVLLARALGLPDNQFAGSPIVRIDFDKPSEIGLDVPSGNEAGTWDEEWLPGGVLPDGRLEAVIKPVDGSYTTDIVS